MQSADGKGGALHWYLRLLWPGSYYALSFTLKMCTTLGTAKRIDGWERLVSSLTHATRVARRITVLAPALSTERYVYRLCDNQSYNAIVCKEEGQHAGD